ncbi:MAG: 1-acyl-sn-glycerol-3-phosphate acyltransferase [Faecousia sp.]
MKKEQRPVRTVYYTDERNDEFSRAEITPRTIDEAYVYTPAGRGWRVRHFIAYRLVATPIAWLYCKLALRSTFRNRQVLRQVKGKGFFVYGNHTQEIGDAFLPTLALCPEQVYVIVHPNNVSMPVLGKVTPYLGALPLPSNLKAMRNFKEALQTRIQEGHCVMIYPEAHIWPYYTGIRDFPATSMKYPVELGAPSLVMTTTYRRRRFGRKPRTVTYLDGPFYPDESLSPRQQVQDLRDRIHETMTRRSRESDCEYIRYQKKEEPV